MSRKTIATAASTAALLGAVVLPAGAAADYYIPPGNSAVNQYTESFPGAGGETGGDKKKVTPAQTLGAKNAKALEKRGQAGTEAAEVAAETAPPADLYVDESSGNSKDNGGNAGGPSNTGNGKAGGSTGGGAGGTPTAVDQPAGSSGLSSVLGQATGAGDGGNIGLWLPLAILATLAGVIAYRVRLRHEHGPTA